MLHRVKKENDLNHDKWIGVGGKFEAGEMPEECRKVFLLSRYGDKSYAEIADELNISVNTVKYHIKKALSLLREELKDYILAITALYFYLFNQ